MKPTWTSLGPSHLTGLENFLPCAGRIDTVDVSPDFDGRGTPAMYLGTPGGGVWRSSDFTSSAPTWTPLTDHPPGVTDADRVNMNVVSTLCVDPTNSRFVYAQDGAGAAVLKSSDGGDSWTVIGKNGFGSAGGIARVLADPTGAVSIAFILGGFWQSTNGGSNWTNVAPAALSDVEFHDAVFFVDGTGTTQVFVGVVDRKGNGRGGIWSLINGTWKQMPMSLQNLRGQSFQRDVINHITLSSNRTAGVCASLSQVDDGNTKIGVLNAFRLINGTWQPQWASQTDWINTQGGYVQGLCLASDGRIYSGGIGISQSSGGSGFSAIGTDSNGSAIHVDVHVIIEHQGQIYVGTDGGLFRFTPQPNVTGVDRWESLNTPSLQNFLATGATVDPVASGIVLVGNQDNGIGRRSTNGQWTSSGYSNEREIVRFDPFPANAGNYAYSADPNNGFYWSQDNGVTFTGFGPPGVPAPDPPPPYAFHPTDSARLLIGWMTVFETPDRGATWNKRLTLTQAPTAVAYEGPQSIYVGASGQLFQSFNDGVSWSVDSFTFGDSIVAITADTANPDAIYLATSSRVFRRPSRTSPWEELTGNLTLAINTLRVKPRWAGQDPWLFVATGAGVFLASRLTRNTTWWTRYGSGLPDSNVQDLEIHTDTGLLVAATWGRGAWSTQIAPDPPSVKVIPKRDDCGVFSVAGGTATVSASPSQLNAPFAYQWFATDTTIVGSSTAASATFTSPALGQTATLSVIVTDADGAVVAASLDVTSISQQIAAVEYFLCNLRKTLGLFDPLWWIETRGGLVPPGPPDPWLWQFGVATILASAASRSPAERRERILEIALEEMSAAVVALRQEIGRDR
jgi:hypothetical protein